MGHPRRRARNPHFFERSPDKSVRVRIRLLEDDANLIEEAAGKTYVMEWITKTLRAAAQADIEKAKRNRPNAGRPSD